MTQPFVITITAVDKATAVAKKVNESIARITKPVTDLHASVASFGKETGLDRLGRGLRKVSDSAANVAHNMRSIAPPLAALTGFGTVASIATMANSWGKMARGLDNTARSLGMSTNDLQKYQKVAELAGLSSDDMTGSLKSLGQVMETSKLGLNPQATAAMATFGIQVHRLKNGSVDTVRALRDISGVIAKMPNAQAAQRFARIFGVENLLPMLQKGPGYMDQLIARTEKLHLLMSPQDINNGLKFSDSMLQLDASAEKLANSLGSSLTPALTKVIDGLTGVANREGPKVAAWLNSIDWDKTAKKVDKYVDSLGGVKTIATGIAAITLAGPIGAVAKLLKGVGKLAVLAGRLGLINPVTAGLYAMLHSEDLNKGEDDYLGKRRKLETDVIENGGWQPYMAYPAGQKNPVADPLFAKLEKQYNLPKGLLDSVWNAESGRGMHMRSPAGALGHFQFMPETAKQYGVTNPFNLKDAATGAAKMYADLLKQNKGDLQASIAAYNWGEGNVQKVGLMSAPQETREYVRKVLGGMGRIDQPSSIYSSPQAPAADQQATTPTPARAASESNQKVTVDVHVHGLPPGAQVHATERSSGAPARIFGPLITGPSI